MNINESIRLKVDLMPLGKGNVECEGHVEFNSLNQPEKLTLILTGMDQASVNRFCQPQLAVRDVFGQTNVAASLPTGSQFEGEIVYIKGVGFGAPGTVHVECYLGSVSEASAAKVDEAGHWSFGLSNYKIFRGDTATEQPPPAQATSPELTVERIEAIAQWHAVFGDLTSTPPPPKPDDFKILHGAKRLNRITFTVAGREWTVDDEQFGRWPKDVNKIAEPVCSGTLATAFRTGDSSDQIQQAADDISELLSLALGRDIKWVRCARHAADDAVQSVHFRKPGLLAFNQHGSCLADNWEPQNLKQFLEAGEQVLTSDREWWSITIGLVTQVRGSQNLQVKCSLLNTLLDRITSKINVDVAGTEIDPKLNERLDRRWFRWLLHLLLSTLSSKWEWYRTDALCDNIIKSWNAEPSFPEKIMRCCVALGIQAPSRSKLGFRHKLIHSGEFDKKLKTFEKKAEYLFDTEAIVLMLLVRLLKFDGFIYLQKLPPDPKRVQEFLDPNTQA